MTKATEASRPAVPEVLDRRHATEDVGKQDIEDCAHDKRTENAERHVTFRILGLLRCRRHRIEADERKEHHTGCTEDAHQASVGVRDALRGRVGHCRRNKRRVVGRIDESPADRDHHQDDGDLRDHDDTVDERGFAGAANKEPRQNGENHHRRDVHDSLDAVRGLPWSVTPFVRDIHPHELENTVEILAPRDRHGGRADRVFEDQIPSDDPRDELAHGGVPVRVRATGDRDHRRELRVAQTREQAPDRRHQECQRDRWTGTLRDGRRRAHEETCADDGANPQCHQLPPAEGALQRSLATGFGFGQQAVNRLSSEQ